MNRNNILKVLIITPMLAAVAVWLLNCATTTDFQRSGFRDIRTGFAMLPPIEAPVVVDIPAIRVHLLPPGTVPMVAKGRCSRSGVVGCASRAGEVWLEGRIGPNGIVINQAVAGHEFQHLLNFADGAVADPDEATK